MPASNNLSNTFYKFDVLLDIGSHTNTFSYLDGYNLGVEIGDIVSVRLKGRLLNGLTISKSPFFTACNRRQYAEGLIRFHLYVRISRCACRCTDCLPAYGLRSFRRPTENAKRNTEGKTKRNTYKSISSKKGRRSGITGNGVKTSSDRSGIVKTMLKRATGALVQ